MTFQEPSYLLGMVSGLLVVLLGIRAARGRRRALEAFSRLHPRLTGAGTPARQAGEYLLLALALVMLSLALAGPVSKAEETGAVREGIDILFCVDTSRSMQAREGDSTRLEIAVREIESLLESAAGHRLGLVAFAGGARLICPLTHDLEGFRHFLGELDLYSAPLAGSAMGEGLRMALDVLGGEEDRVQVIVLVSDGEDLDEAHPPEAVAREAVDREFRVYPVMFGAPEGAKILLEDGDGFIRDSEGLDVISRPDPLRMARIAESGGGTFIAAWETAFPMDFLYTRHLANLEFSEQEEKRLSRKRPAFQWFGFFALLLLLFDLFLPSRRFERGAAVILVLVMTGVLAPTARAAEGDAFDEGVRHFRANEFDAALRCFEKAASEGPGMPGIDVNLGLSHLELGHGESAAFFFGRALASGKPEAVRAARFGSGLAAYSRGESLMKRIAESGAPGVEKGLNEALVLYREAGTFFIGCLEEGIWPKEAAVNLELSNRMMGTIEKRLHALAGKEEPQPGTGAGDPVDEGDAAGGSEGGGGVRTGESGGSSEKDEVAGAGGEPAGSPDSPRVRLEEKQQIFAFLEALEQKRIALERAIERASRKQQKGVRDW